MTAPELGALTRLRRKLPADLRLYAGGAESAFHRGIARRRPPSLAAALAELSATWPLSPADDDPVFLLSAGWRSGSTLLQRLVSSGGVLVWGEPFREGALMTVLAQSLLAFDPARGRFSRNVLDERTAAGLDAAALSQEWTATLGPSPAALLEGHRALYRRVFAEPAAGFGFGRWGVKEIGLRGEAARYLSVLFPRARFVFLTRHPLAAWRSYRPVVARPWYYTWPDRPVAGPFGFGRMWAELAGSFLQAQQDVGALHLRYEDLRLPATLDRLEDHLGLQLDRSVLDRTVGSSLDRSRYRASVPRWERAVVWRRTAEVAVALGYRPAPDEPR